VERPIAFNSHSLTAAEKNNAQIHREALLIYWGVKKFFPLLFGRHFTLIIDHEPSVLIFHQEKETPAMTAARLQRYALFLSSLNYTIVYRNTNLHGNCDCLSRLPLLNTEADGDTDITDPADVFAINQLESLYVSVTEMQHKAQGDAVSSQVYQFALRGWPKAVNAALCPYFTRGLETSIHQRCLLWSGHVIIPAKLRY